MKIHEASDLPESGKRVIFGWDGYGKRRTSIGFYAAPKSINADDFDEPESYEYDEEKDCYWLQEGWYEDGAEGEYFYPVHNVTHWTELPEWPLPNPPERKE